VRNHRSVVQKHRIALKLPPGLEATPAVLEGTVAGRSRQTFPVKITVKDRRTVLPGVQIVAFDITLDDRRYGELFDFVTLTRE
jgi:hypothetical protein